MASGQHRYASRYPTRPPQATRITIQSVESRAESPSSRDSIPLYLFLTSTVSLVMICIFNYSPECTTISCTTDSGEITDRVSSASLTLQAIGTIYVWQKNRIPVWLILIDLSLMFGVIVVSDDVAEEAHSYIALAFATVRILVTFTLVRSRPSTLQIYCIISLRSFGVVFLVGYSCVNAIPDLCATLSSAVLPGPLVLASELGLVLSGVGYLALTLLEGPPWKSDGIAFATFSMGTALSAILLFVKFSWSSFWMVLILIFMDGVFVRRCWKEGNLKTYNPSSMGLAILVLSSSIYALT
jgi:hypothetical protein